MPVGAAVGSAVGGGLAAFGSMKAADKQAQSAKQSLAMQQQMYEQGRQDIAPYRETGGQALQSLAQLYGLGGQGGEAYNQQAMDAFRRSPDYQFNLTEGKRALDAELSSLGQRVSGNYGRALADYSQGLASRTFGDYVQRLSGLAGMGQNAASSSASLGQNASQLMGQTQQQLGQAQASGYVGPANAINGTLGNIANQQMFYNALGQQNQSAYKQPIYNGWNATVQYN